VLSSLGGGQRTSSSVDGVGWTNGLGLLAPHKPLSRASSPSKEIVVAHRKPLDGHSSRCFFNLSAPGSDIRQQNQIPGATLENSPNTIEDPHYPTAQQRTLPADMASNPNDDHDTGDNGVNADDHGLASETNDPGSPPRPPSPPA
jgi:hypothetical protein